MTPYDMREQLKKGEGYELVLDAHFRGKGIMVQKVDMVIQRHGIDRVLIMPDRRVFTVEYKADERGDATGNVFIETVSVDTADKPGWAYTSWAQVLVYFLPQRNLFYWVSMLTLKNRLPKWLKVYSLKEAINMSYTTLGIVIPIKVLQNCAPGGAQFVSLEER